MEMTRPYTEQFSPQQAAKISELIHDFDRISSARPGYVVFSSEIRGCLFNGLLLAALGVSSSLLELFVRDLVVALRIQQRYSGDMGLRGQVENDLEADRQLGFVQMVQELTDLVITPADAKELERFYDSIRIPLSHGLIRRFTSDGTGWLEDLFADVARRSKLEDAIESRAIGAIEFVVAIIARYLPWLDRRLSASGQST